MSGGQSQLLKHFKLKSVAHMGLISAARDALKWRQRYDLIRLLFGPTTTGCLSDAQTAATAHSVTRDTVGLRYRRATRLHAHALTYVLRFCRSTVKSKYCSARLYTLVMPFGTVYVAHKI